MANHGPQSNTGMFVPTTNIWDIQKIEEIDLKSPEFRDLLVRLYQNINNISLALNIKETGYYPLVEFVDGNAWFPDPTLNSTTQRKPILRQEFRLVVDFGALPDNTTKSVAHGLTITSGYSFTRIYGTGTNPSTKFIPIPYVTASGTDGIELFVDATHVTMITTGNYSAYTKSYVVIEYIKT